MRPTGLFGCCDHAYSCSFLTPLLLLACHNVNRFAASCTVVIFPLSYRTLYCVDGAKIKDTAITIRVGLINRLGMLKPTGPRKNKGPLHKQQSFGD